MFVLGEEALVLARQDEARRITVHGAARLDAGADGSRSITGGDDGKGMATDASGASTAVSTDPKHRWIDHVAIGPAGAVAWSAGKTAFVRSGKGDEHALDVPSTVGALA